MLPPLKVSDSRTPTSTDARVGAESVGGAPCASHLLSAAVSALSVSSPRLLHLSAQPPPPRRTMCTSKSPLDSSRESPTPRRPTALRAAGPSPLGRPACSPRSTAARAVMPTISVSTAAGATTTTTTTTTTTAASGSQSIDQLSLIPREFFVLETNAVLPERQYPVDQYESKFQPERSAWETVVFPALVPHTRQQVLQLATTLTSMRAHLQATSSHPMRPSTTNQDPAASSMGFGEEKAEGASLEHTLDMMEVEGALHSVCFHELARQIRCICREQSDLLHEIRAFYALQSAQLLALVRRLQRENERRDVAFSALQEQHDNVLEHHASLVARGLLATHDGDNDDSGNLSGAARGDDGALTASRARQLRREAEERKQQRRLQRRRRHRQRERQRCRLQRRRSQRLSVTGSPGFENEDEQAEAEEKEEADGSVLSSPSSSMSSLASSTRSSPSDSSSASSGSASSLSSRSSASSLASHHRPHDRHRHRHYQRRSRKQGSSSKARRVSLLEQEAAAQRVQQAFQKYVLHKEQSRLLRRQEKTVAATEIQRWFRGYRHRKRVVHHRAVCHVLGQRRAQIAAVELLQTNVRAYLLQKRYEQAHGHKNSPRYPSSTHHSHHDSQAQRHRHHHHHHRHRHHLHHYHHHQRPRHHRGRGEPALGQEEECGDLAASVDADASIGEGSDGGGGGLHQPYDEAGGRGGKPEADVINDATTVMPPLFGQLLSRISELASVFRLLHSRRQRIQRQRQKARREDVSVSVSVSVSMGVGGAEEVEGASATDARSSVREKSEAQAAKEDGGHSGRGHVDADVKGLMDGEQDKEEKQVVGGPEEDIELLNETIRRAEDLVQSFHAAIVELKTNEVLDDRLSIGLTQPLPSEGAVDGAMAAVDEEEDCSDRDGDGVGEEEASEPSEEDAPAVGFLFVDDDECDVEYRRINGRIETSASEEGSDDQGGASDGDSDEELHVDEDDALWQISACSPDYPQMTTAGSSMPQRRLRPQQLRAMLQRASREQVKTHAWLKQLILDVYDTVVGRLRELGPTRLAQLIEVHASLSLSLTDGRRLLRRRRRRRHRHHRLDHASVHTHARSSASHTTNHQDSALDDHQTDERALAASEPASEYEPVRAFITVELRTLIRDHFRCQLGLPALVSGALSRMEAALDAFRGMDADVARFHGFLTLARSHDELVFFCVARLLAATPMSTPTAATATAMMAGSPDRQPVLHETTRHEVIDLSRALALARVHFRVDDEPRMLREDAVLMEPTNAVYRRHLPSTCLAQLESILSHHIISPDEDTNDNANGNASGHRENAEPLRTANLNRFHAPPFNANAPRSPLVRPCNSTSLGSSRSSANAPVWLLFGDVVTLLYRYRAVMTRFHALTRWVHEQFLRAAMRQHREQMQATQAEVVVSPSLSPSPSLSQPQPQLQPQAQTHTQLPFSRPDALLLEEAAFVAILLPHAVTISERDLRNVFHNALAQRHLQRLMPTRVFVSVVLTLLHSRQLSVALALAATRGTITTPTALLPVANRLQTEETQWRQLARQWRAQEKRLEAALERIYAIPSCVESSSDGEGGEQPETRAWRLLQWRNELYDLFVARRGRTHLERAETLCQWLGDAMTEVEAGEKEPPEQGEKEEQAKREEEEGGSTADCSRHNTEQDACDSRGGEEKGNGDADSLLPGRLAKEEDASIGSPWDTESSRDEPQLRALWTSARELL